MSKIIEQQDGIQSHESHNTKSKTVQKTKEISHYGWLDVDEVVSLVLLPKSTIKNWFKSERLQKNNIKSKKINSETRVLLTDILTYLKDRSIPYADTFTHFGSIERVSDVEKYIVESQESPKSHSESHKSQAVVDNHIGVSIEGLYTQQFIDEKNERIQLLQDQNKQLFEHIKLLQEQFSKQINTLITADTQTKSLLYNQQVLQKNIQEKIEVVVDGQKPIIKALEHKPRKKFLGLF